MLLERAVELVDTHLGPRVAQRVADKPVAHHAHLGQRGFGLRDEFFPGGAFGRAGVDGDEATTRGLEVGEEPEHRSVIAHEVVAGVEVVEQFDHRGAGLLKILIEEPVPRIRALADREQQVVAIIGHARAEAPLGLVLALVHQPVGRLRRAHGVEVDLLELVHRRQRGTGFRGVVAGVVEARAVFGPRDAGELHPFDAVGQFLAGGHIADANLLPVTAALRELIGDLAAIFGRFQTTDGDGSVGAEFVGVEQEGRFSVESGGGVPDALVLQAVVAAEKIPIALFGGHPEALEVEELSHPLANALTLRDVPKVTERHFVLALHPVLSRRSVVVFEPSVRIFDADPVVGVDDVGLRRGGVLEGITHQIQGGE